MTSSNQMYPQLCADVGLTCESCTSSSARELARACPGLAPRAVAQLFVQIHTHTACARMHRHFAQAYAEADAGVPVIPVRQPARRVAAMAAVA